ncbi:MAG: RNA polymerase sigma factor [Thermoanaerobaculia bacterium]|nr:RNA polymerase sigma factor [Thermoanaerobaculia bacterium]MCZ7650265.1 RNA polymerase sigma factor [Thermoanaerobaculia bacterium]
MDALALEGSAAPPWVADVEAARGGDAEAFGRLLELFWGESVRLARAILASDLEAEDVAQEAFVAAWRKLGWLRDPARFDSWLRRGLVRRAVRRARLRRFVPLTRVAEPAAEPMPSRLDATALLGALTPRQRLVFVLSELDGVADAAIADLLHIAPSTVRVLRHQARRRLEALLGS